jgi:hypothetical protein
MVRKQRGTKWRKVRDSGAAGRDSLFVGYLVGAGAMILGGFAAIFFGVAAEGKSFADIARPLSSSASGRRPSSAPVRLNPGA